MVAFEFVVNTVSALQVSDLAVPFTGAVLMGFWKEMNSMRKQMIQWQAKIDTTLFGASGSNGLSGTSKDHEERIRILEHDRMQHNTQHRIT